MNPALQYRNYGKSLKRVLIPALQYRNSENAKKKWSTVSHFWGLRAQIEPQYLKFEFLQSNRPHAGAQAIWGVRPKPFQNWREIDGFYSVRKRFAMPLWGRAPRARFNEFIVFSEFRKLRRKRISVRLIWHAAAGRGGLGIIWYARIVGTLGMAVDRVHLLFW